MAKGYKTGGRKKGTKNKPKASDEIRKMIKDIVHASIPKLKDEVDKLKGKEFVWAVDKLAQISLEKQVSELSVTGDVTASVQWRKDMEALDKIPADVLANITEMLQTSISAPPASENKSDGNG